MKKKYIAAAILLGLSIAGSAIAKLALPVDLSTIPLTQRLMASTTDLLGSRVVSDGAVQYAYKTHSLGSVDAGEKTQLEALARHGAVGPVIQAEIVGERTPHMRVYSTDQPGVHVAEIIAGQPQFYKDVDGVWYQVEYATTTQESFNKQVAVAQRLSWWATTALADCTSPCTFYPDSNAVDGMLFRDSLNESFASKRGATSADHNDYTSADNNGAYLNSYGGVNGNYNGMYRAVTLFDTSSLPDTATIVSATYSIYSHTGRNALSQSVVVDRPTPASNTTLANADYNVSGKWDGVEQASNRITLATWAASDAYQAFTLNATGLSNISLTGITKLGMRLSSDFDNSAPTWVADQVADGEWYASEQTGTSQDPKLVVTFSDTALIAPTALQVEAQTNPVNVATSNPRFSALVNSASTTALATSYEIQVATSSSYWGVPYWDSAQQTLSSSTPRAQRTPYIYSTTTFALNGGVYYWRIKLWDQTGGTGIWSTSTASFSMTTSGGYSYPTTTLQDLTYVYDAAGNITKIVAKSGTDGTGTTTFQYDNLYRLVNATETQSSADYTQSYVYDWLNMTNKSDVGSYTYAATGYASPLAATQIGSNLTLSYDSSGNTTSMGSSTYTWDYRDRMTDSAVNSTTTHYAYDANDQRVQMDVKNGSGATTTTKYFNQYYETTGATTTMYIYAGGQLLTTIEGNGSATSTNIIHTDHLGGTNVVSDGTGNLKQLVENYPYGSGRINEQPSSGFNEQRKFIGQFADDSTGLSYLNARYYDPLHARFMSEDPVARDVAMMKKQARYILSANVSAEDFDQTALLSNPQMLNSYSYAISNPINMRDPSGLTIDQVLAGRESWSSYGTELSDPGQFAYLGTGNGSSDRAWNYALDNPYKTSWLYVAPLSTAAAWSGAMAWYTVPSITASDVSFAYAANRAIATAIGISSALNNPNTISSALKGAASAPAGSSPMGVVWAAGKAVVTDKLTSVGNSLWSGVQTVAGALVQIQNAFVSTNAAQAKAIQNVIVAFSGRK